MKKETKKTDVKFFVHKEDKEIYAFFPKEIESKKWNLKDGKIIFYLSYAHVGQHSGCCKKYTKESRPATQSERKALIKELESIGYNLNIKN